MTVLPLRSNPRAAAAAAAEEESHALVMLGEVVVGQLSVDHQD